MSWRAIGRILFVTVFVASLLLNAVTLGVLLRLRAAGLGPLAGGSAVREMPAELRRDVLGALRQNRDELGALRSELRARRAEMIAAAKAEPVDPARLAATMAEVRAATAALQRAAHEALLPRLAGDGPEAAGTQGGRDPPGDR